MIVEFLERRLHIGYLNLNVFSGHFSLTVGEKRSEDIYSQRLDRFLPLFPQQWQPKVKKGWS